tara:strand:- start:176 stop:382 length:207 start_codon:yes stop_codon:yes gene_type:complete
MDFKKLKYMEILEVANSLYDKNDREGLLIIKQEFINRIDSKEKQEKSPSWGSLMGYYQICSLIESLDR